jgi:hypothetical protein
MKIKGQSQTVILTMPQVDLLLTCMVPEFRSLLARFPNQIKVQATQLPCQLFINRMVVPFFLNTKSNWHAMSRIRESLKVLPPSRVK